MSKLIGLLIILIVAAIGYALFNYFQKVKEEGEGSRQEEVVVEVVPTSLPGLPYQLEESLTKAQAQGYKAFRDWMKAYGAHVQDPRKAWIELDFVIAMSSEDPGNARKLFQQVKDRTPVTSPVYPRIKKLEKTFE
jgi:epoxyqueuosine reductase QueG